MDRKKEKYMRSKSSCLPIGVKLRSLGKPALFSIALIGALGLGAAHASGQTSPGNSSNASKSGAGVSRTATSVTYRRGGTAIPGGGGVAPEHPMWVEFARAMAPLAGMASALLANLLDVEHAPAWKVLDVAAGHGLFGITLARMNPKLHVTALDWPNVLTVARDNARAAGVAERFDPLPGSAFDVPFGGPYDVILLPNILHHFDQSACERLLKKAHGALVPGGRVVIVEFVPDDDRSGPPDAVRFALVMLAGTPAGDAYTFGEYRTMLAHAGFGSPSLHELAPSPARVVIVGR